MKSDSSAVVRVQFSLARPRSRFDAFQQSVRSAARFVRARLCAGARALLRGYVLLAVSSAHAPAERARAQGGPASSLSAVQLTWSAPPGCPEGTDAWASLAQLLYASSGAVAPHAATVRLVQHGATYQADIEFSGALTGRRILHGSACQAVADAAVLSVAIAVDPGAVVRYVGGMPRRARSADGAPPFHAGVRVGGDLGSLPAATLGIGLVGGLSLQRLRLDLELDWWQSQTKFPVRTDGGGAKIGQVDSSLRACFALLSRARYDVGPCFSLSAGWSRGKGVRLAAPEKSGGLVLAPLLGLRGRQRSERLFFEAGADVGLSVAHPQYRIDDLPAVGSPSPSWFGRLSLVFGWLWR